jgi:hypothetical protein
MVQSDAADLPPPTAEVASAEASRTEKDRLPCLKI